MNKAVEFLRRNENNFYFAFRVLIGLLFVQHGAQKLFGAFGGNQVELMNLFAFDMSSLFVLAGIIEFFGGLFIALGLLTRLAAFFGIADMIGAWTFSHLKKGVIPILNGGELSALFFSAFLILLVWGKKKWGLDNVFFKRK